ncbi:MAG: hypothetical protein HY696_03170 [Deltaproteobacteria bacterium]|nr:hypothetical protein [Deltaproteobacteria bacterium]
MTFLVLPRTLSNDFHASLVAGVKAEALGQQIALDIQPTPTEDDYAFQIRQLQITGSKPAVQGVIIEPGHSANLLFTLQQFDQRGIPFIVVDNPLAFPNDYTLKHYCGFVGTDNQR